MIWQRHPQAAWEPAETADGGYFAVNATRGGIVALQDNAALIWETLPGRTTAEVVSSVAADYGLEDAAIAADVASFLADLERQGLVIQT